MKGFMFGCALGVLLILLSVITAMVVVMYPVVGMTSVLGGVVLFFGWMFSDF